MHILVFIVFAQFIPLRIVLSANTMQVMSWLDFSPQRSEQPPLVLGLVWGNRG